MLQLVRRNRQTKNNLHPIQKKNYKDSIWIEDLNVKPETNYKVPRKKTVRDVFVTLSQA